MLKKLFVDVRPHIKIISPNWRPSPFCQCTRFKSKKSAKNDTSKSSIPYSGAEYFKFRLKQIENGKNEGRVLYPHKFTVSHTAEKILSSYDHLEKGNASSDQVSVAGRVHVVREASKHLRFYDIINNGIKIQIVANLKGYENQDSYITDCDNVARGDIIGVNGNPKRTNSGELSVQTRKVTVLTPCLRMLPSVHDGVTDRETRYRQRYLDLLFNDTSRKKFILRSKIISYIRNYFQNLGFLEVETPLLNSIPSGANAKPFKTHHQNLDIDLYLRVAPELYLKTLVIGGLDRVFEVGRQFRNEGSDQNHNPEFTACEFYMAYADYSDVMDMTEKLLSEMVYSIFGNYSLKYHTGIKDEFIEINFKPPFKRLKVMESLEKSLAVTFPPAHQLHTEQSKTFLLELCLKHGINASSIYSNSKLFDKLISHFISPSCLDPTFVMDYPSIMNPLAKNHRSMNGLSERFELFVAKMEVCNAYTELNDPMEQRARFRQQLMDEEAQPLDENYCKSLEYGLPPTAGWGMGIDRLVMILTDSPHIKEVILFPTLRPENVTEQNLVKDDIVKPN